MKRLLYYLILTIFCALNAEATDHLTPADFGLKLNQYRQIDMGALPPDILVDCFDGDDYEDIARFSGNRVEIYLWDGNGFLPNPAMVKYFDRNIKSIRREPVYYFGYSDIVVTLSNGSEERISNTSSGLQIDPEPHPFAKPHTPRFVRDVDFELVWESEQYGYDMRRCAVGDIDNDGIIELVTCYRDSQFADSAWMLIYKYSGDDEYEIFMREYVRTEEPASGFSYVLITDFDGNGQKEIAYTLAQLYIWEFSAPGVYTYYNTDVEIFLPVEDAVESDVDQDGIKELTLVGEEISEMPPCVYQVYEYYHKFATLYSFHPMSEIWQYRRDKRLAVGDFDNDGAVDIVGGNFGGAGFTPIDIPFKRYEVFAPEYFTEYYLYTGLPSVCSTPEIGDFDGDSLNELFSGGCIFGKGSSFIYKPTGFQQGYIAWWDTTTLEKGQNEATLYFMNGIPVITSIAIIDVPVEQSVMLWIFNSYDNVETWMGPNIEPNSYQNPHLIDTDADDLYDIVVASGYYHSLHVYSEVPNGIYQNPHNNIPELFSFEEVFPNPFNNSTTISFSINKQSNISIKIYNITGKEVYSYKQSHIQPGEYVHNWDASDLSSGIYFIRLETGEHTSSVRVLLMK